jgi:hypothetical protein
MIENLLEKLCLCFRASCKSALRPEVLAAEDLFHKDTPFLAITIIIIFQDSRHRRNQNAKCGHPSDLELATTGMSPCLPRVALFS